MQRRLFLFASALLQQNNRATVSKPAIRFFHCILLVIFFVVASKHFLSSVTFAIFKTILQCKPCDTIWPCLKTSFKTRQEQGRNKPNCAHELRLKTLLFPSIQLGALVLGLAMPLAWIPQLHFGENQGLQFLNVHRKTKFSASETQQNVDYVSVVLTFVKQFGKRNVRR